MRDYVWQTSLEYKLNMDQTIKLLIILGLKMVVFDGRDEVNCVVDALVLFSATVEQSCVLYKC